MAPSIRLAGAYDAEDILSIYAPIVRETVVSFALVPPTVEEMRRHITETLARRPWLVCAEEGRVQGYVYAGPHRASRHRTHTAYQWSVEVSVYVRAGVRRRGIGRALYTSLFEILRHQGYVNAYAGVTLPNPASVGLHEAMGFEPVGVYRGVGFKHGTWHDVGWWQMQLQARCTPPAAPVDLDVVCASPQWDAALHAGLPLLGM